MEIVKPDYIKFIYAKAKKLVFLTPLLCVVIILFPAFFILNYFSLFTEYDCDCSRGWQKGLRWGSDYESTYEWRSRRVTA